MPRSSLRGPSARLGTQEYVDEVVRGVRGHVQEFVARMETASTPPPPAADLVNLIAAGLPFPAPDLDPYFAGVGPFYDTNGVRAQLGGISKQAVDERRKCGSVLAMRAGEGRWVYPAWQFTGDGRVHGCLVPVLAALRAVPTWAAAVWLVTPVDELGGQSPRQALAAGVEPSVVASLAAHAAGLATAR